MSRPNPATSPALDLSAYESWLRKEDYQDSTVVVSLRHIRGVAADPERLREHQLPHIRRYLRFVKLTKKNPLGRDVTDSICARHKLKASSAVKKHGERSKKRISTAVVLQLRSTLRRGDDTSKLLVAYMQSGMRISEFLRMRKSGVSVSTMSDKISRDWLDTRLKGNAAVYTALCSTERCAYARLRKRLQEVALHLGVELDLDTLYKSMKDLL